MMLTFEERTRAILDAVARLGSFSAAGRSLGLDAANARRHVRTAEERAGVALVEARRGGRGGRNATLTSAGRRLLGRRGLGGRVVGYDEGQGVSEVRVGAQPLFVAGEHAAGPVEVVVPPESVVLEASPPQGARSPRNAIPMRVEAIRPERDGVWRVRLARGALKLDALVVTGALRDLALRPGRRVHATVKAVAIRVRPAS